MIQKSKSSNQPNHKKAKKPLKFTEYENGKRKRNITEESNFHTKKKSLDIKTQIQFNNYQKNVDKHTLNPNDHYNLLPPKPQNLDEKVYPVFNLKQKIRPTYQSVKYNEKERSSFEQEIEEQEKKPMKNQMNSYQLNFTIEGNSDEEIKNDSEILIENKTKETTVYPIFKLEKKNSPMKSPIKKNEQLKNNQKDEEVKEIHNRTLSSIKKPNKAKKSLAQEEVTMDEISVDSDKSKFLKNEKNPILTSSNSILRTRKNKRKVKITPVPQNELKYFSEWDFLLNESDVQYLENEHLEKEDIKKLKKKEVEDLISKLSLKGRIQFREEFNLQ
eukprot:gene12192-5779_t